MSDKQGYFQALLPGAFITCLLLTGCDSSVGNEKGENVDRMSSRNSTQASRTVRTFGASTTKDLTIEGKEPVLVFAVYDNGIVGFRSPKTKEAFVPKLPLHAENILMWEALSVVKTENPKFCWIDTQGLQKCVLY